MLDVCVVATDEHRHVAADGCVDRTGHGRIYRSPTASAKLLAEPAHKLRAAGGEVDPILVLAASRQEPFVAANDRFDFLWPEHHGDHDVDLIQDIGRTCRRDSAYLDQWNKSIRTDVVNDSSEASAHNIERRVAPIIPNPMKPTCILSSPWFQFGVIGHISVIGLRNLHCFRRRQTARHRRLF